MTIFSPDPNIYCAAANSGYDFTWIEMQHSPLTFGDVAHMIWACRGASAMPFIRVPDATESDIQKATDIGAIGIIVPTVDTVEKAEAAVKWARYPPQGRRSQGNGQYGQLWGNDYRQISGTTMMLVAGHDRNADRSCERGEDRVGAGDRCDLRRQHGSWKFFGIPPGPARI